MRQVFGHAVARGMVSHHSVVRRQRGSSRRGDCVRIGAARRWVGTALSTLDRDTEARDRQHRHRHEQHQPSATMRFGDRERRERERRDGAREERRRGEVAERCRRTPRARTIRLERSAHDGHDAVAAAEYDRRTSAPARLHRRTAIRMASAPTSSQSASAPMRRDEKRRPTVNSRTRPGTCIGPKNAADPDRRFEAQALALQQRDQVHGEHRHDEAVQRERRTKRDECAPAASGGRDPSTYAALVFPATIGVTVLRHEGEMQRQADRGVQQRESAQRSTPSQPLEALERQGPERRAREATHQRQRGERGCGTRLPSAGSASRMRRRTSSSPSPTPAIAHAT